MRFLPLLWPAVWTCAGNISTIAEPDTWNIFTSARKLYFISFFFSSNTLLRCFVLKHRVPLIPYSMTSLIKIIFFLDVAKQRYSDLFEHSPFLPTLLPRAASHYNYFSFIPQTSYPWFTGTDEKRHKTTHATLLGVGLSVKYAECISSLCVSTAQSTNLQYRLTKSWKEWINVRWKRQNQVKCDNKHEGGGGFFKPWILNLKFDFREK